MNDAAAIHRKTAFCVMRDLDLEQVDENALWQRLKSEYGDVTSRSEWSAEQWAIVSARLVFYRQNPQFLYEVLS